MRETRLLCSCGLLVQGLRQSPVPSQIITDEMPAYHAFMTVTGFMTAFIYKLPERKNDGMPRRGGP